MERVDCQCDDPEPHCPPEFEENPAFPKGVQIATLVGDPTKAGGVVVLRIKFPPNFQMPPHTHPYSEVVTVISGNIGTSHGEKV
jgi:quercetin dioxygenase-like cupin family protein